MVWPWTLTFWPKNVIGSSVSRDAPVTKVWWKSVNRYWRYRGNIKLPKESRTDGRTHGQRHGRTTRKHIASAAAASKGLWPCTLAISDSYCQRSDADQKVENFCLLWSCFYHCLFLSCCSDHLFHSSGIYSLNFRLPSFCCYSYSDLFPSMAVLWKKTTNRNVFL